MHVTVVMAIINRPRPAARRPRRPAGRRLPDPIRPLEPGRARLDRGPQQAPEGDDVRWAFGARGAHPQPWGDHHDLLRGGLAVAHALRGRVEPQCILKLQDKRT